MHFDIKNFHQKISNLSQIGADKIMFLLKISASHCITDTDGLNLYKMLLYQNIYKLIKLTSYYLTEKVRKSKDIHLLL